MKSLPSKTKRIESKLDGFREVKLLHEIKAVKLKQLEE